MPCWDADVVDHSPGDEGTRGGLTVADRVIDKIASHAASSVEGVVDSGSTLDKVVGRRLPRATSEVRGQHARVHVEVAVQWPLALSEIAAQVRSTVSRAVTDLAGLHVPAVDVTVARVDRATPTVTRRAE